MRHAPGGSFSGDQFDRLCSHPNGIQEVAVFGIGAGQGCETREILSNRDNSHACLASSAISCRRGTSRRHRWPSTRLVRRAAETLSGRWRIAGVHSRQGSDRSLLSRRYTVARFRYVCTVLRRDSNGPVVVRNRFGEFPLQVPGIAASGVRRLQSWGPDGSPRCIRKWPGRTASENTRLAARMVWDRGNDRIDLKRPVTIGQRLLVLALVAPCRGGDECSRGERRFEPNRLVKSGERLIIVSLLKPRRAPPCKDLGSLGIEPNRFVAIGNRLIVIVLRLLNRRPGGEARRRSVSV